MIKYFSTEDEDLTLAVYSDAETHKRIIKTLTNELGYSFFETTDQEWLEFDIDFPLDTIIVKQNNFTEDFIELINKKLYIYVIN
jgi:hypothetical protein